MKKIIITVVSLMFLTTLLVGFYTYQRTSNVDPLIMKNVEALASDDVQWVHCSIYPMPLICVMDPSGNIIITGYRTDL